MKLLLLMMHLRWRQNGTDVSSTHGYLKIVQQIAICFYALEKGSDRNFRQAVR